MLKPCTNFLVHINSFLSISFGAKIIFLFQHLLEQTTSQQALNSLEAITCSRAMVYFPLDVQVKYKWRPKTFVTEFRHELAVPHSVCKICKQYKQAHGYRAYSEMNAPLRPIQLAVHTKTAYALRKFNNSCS